MDAIGTLVNAIMVAVVGVVVLYYMRERFAMLEARIDGVRDGLRAEIDAQGSRLGAEIDAQGSGLRAAMDAQGTGLRAAMDAQGTGLRAEMHRRFEQVDRRFEQTDRRIERLEDYVRAEFGALRSDLTRVALAVGAEPRSETG